MEPLRFVCTAIGACVLAVMVLSVAWVVCVLVVATARDLIDRRRRTVPRAWIAEERRRCDLRYVHSDLRHPLFKDSGR